MKIISIYNAKGGVGKTTTVINLSAALSSRGHNVLAVDLDAQGNLSLASGIEPEEVELSMADAIVDAISDVENGYETLEQATYHSNSDNIDIIPSNYNLINVEFLEMVNELENINAMKSLFSKTDYDYIIMDLPPNINNMLNMAFHASDCIIIPTEEKVYSYRAIGLTRKVLEGYKSLTGLDVDILGVLITKSETDKSSLDMRDVIEEYCEKENIPLFPVRIPKNNKVSEVSGATGVSAVNIKRTGRPPDFIQAYKRLAGDIERRFK
ncbi:AAA family ATPase [Tyzzerella sp. OttesenSCG-928-J15]|nr:AAA family ATPase [Tyzzerella sp. OttesenSCG-928-J15]